MKVTVTHEFINSLMTARGAWTKRGFKILGLRWMPKPGWKQRILGTTIDVDENELKAELQSIEKGTPKRDNTSLFRPELSDNQIHAELHFDGSCNPNPGPNSSGGFVLTINGKRIERTLCFGEGTNNTAEYLALINGLGLALENKVTHLKVYGDSQVVIYGIKGGPSKGGKPHLEALKRKALELSDRFASIEYTWIPREDNSHADRLSTAKP